MTMRIQLFVALIKAVETSFPIIIVEWKYDIAVIRRVNYREE